MDDATANPTATPLLYMRRRLKAPRELVFRMFVEAAHARHWFCPASMTIEFCEIDARPGGRYRIGMRNDEGVHVVGGQFREVMAPERLVMTWVWENGGEAGQMSLLTFRFKTVPDGTDISLTHEFHANPEASIRHRRGWTGVFENLEGYLAR